MSRRVQAFELNSAANLDDITAQQTAIHTADTRRSARMRQYFCAGNAAQPLIATGVVEMLVRVENLCDGVTARLRQCPYTLPVQRVHRQGIAGLGAGNQIMKIAVVIRRPNLFDNHGATRCVVGT